MRKLFLVRYYRLKLLLTAGFEERFQKESSLSSSAVQPTLVKVLLLSSKLTSVSNNLYVISK